MSSQFGSSNLCPSNSCFVLEQTHDTGELLPPTQTTGQCVLPPSGQTVNEHREAAGRFTH